MTISSETVKIQTAGNGSATKYYFTFPIYADADILVIVADDSTGVETELTLNSDYTVSEGYITLTAGTLCPSGSTLNLISNVAGTQSLDMTEGDDLPVESVEDALDRLTILFNQTKEMLSRAVLLPRSTKIAAWTYLYDDNMAFVTAGFSITGTYTIDSGVVTISGLNPLSLVTVDTESEGATDDLDSISGGSAGDVIVLQSANNARAVVCKNGSSLILQGDFTLDSTKDKLLLVCISSGVFHEINRSNNG